jgi:Zn finger protein HypA/HybF involved in hydrogenase expression
MHELSLAEAVFRLAQVRTPAGSQLKSVRVRAGAMRAIDPDAMQWAWHAVTVDAECTGRNPVRLELNLRPWLLRCPKCGREWDSSIVDAHCPACRTVSGYPFAGDELLLESIEVEDQERTKPTHQPTRYPNGQASSRARVCAQAQR